MNWELFAAFLLITMILVVTPGPIVTLVIATGASQGIRAALITVAGTTSGNALLIAGIALGLSWVLANAAMLFEVLRWAGAAYLIWLGVQAWRSAGKTSAAPPPSGVHFRRGVLVALSNPKTIAFFTAFLPQFVDPCAAGRPAACDHVHRVGAAGGAERLRLGGRRRPRPLLVPAAGAGPAAGASVGAGIDRRRHLAVAGAPPGMIAGRRSPDWTPPDSVVSETASTYSAFTPGELGHRLPLRNFLGDEGAKVLRRTGPLLGGELLKAILDLSRRQRGIEFGVQPLDDLLRRAGGRHQPGP